MLIFFQKYIRCAQMHKKLNQNQHSPRKFQMKIISSTFFKIFILYVHVLTLSCSYLAISYCLSEFEVSDIREAIPSEETSFKRTVVLSDVTSYELKMKMNFMQKKKNIHHLSTVSPGSKYDCNSRKEHPPYLG